LGGGLIPKTNILIHEARFSMAQALTAQEIEAGLQGLAGWSYRGDGQTGVLEKAYGFKDFRQAMAFMVRLAFEAESMNHHPEIQNVYASVTLRLSTHDAGNQVTQKDLDLAARIEAVSK